MSLFIIIYKLIHFPTAKLTVVDRGSVNERGSMVGGSGHGGGVGSGAVVGDLSHVAVVAVDVVADMLDPAVGESHGVRALGSSCTVAGLGSVEVGVGIVVSYGVLVGVGQNLISIGLSVVGRGSMVGRGSVKHRGVVGSGCVVGRGSAAVASTVELGSRDGHKGRETREGLEGNGSYGG